MGYFLSLYQNSLFYYLPYFILHKFSLLSCELKKIMFYGFTPTATGFDPTGIVAMTVLSIPSITDTVLDTVFVI